MNGAGVIEDLKQFITATVRQEVTSVREEVADLRTDMLAMEQRLDKKMDDGFAAMGDALSGTHDQLGDHEVRLTKLEQHPA